MNYWDTGGADRDMKDALMGQERQILISEKCSITSREETQISIIFNMESLTCQGIRKVS